MWRKWRNRARELSIQREEENLNAELNLGGENLAMDSGEKYWGWKSAKETLEGQKQTKRKGERMQVRDYAEHGFSTGQRGEKRAVTDWGEERKLGQGQISNVSLGPSYIGLYHRCGAGPIRYGLCGALCNFVSGTSPDSFPDGAKRPNNSSKWG